MFKVQKICLKPTKKVFFKRSKAIFLALCKRNVCFVEAENKKVVFTLARKKFSTPKRKFFLVGCKRKKQKNRRIKFIGIGKHIFNTKKTEENI